MALRYALCASLALGLAACQVYRPADELTLKRINIVDDAGEVRLVIAGALPDPMVRGERLPRVIAPAGILWHDEDGNESGGLVTAPLPDGRLMRFITSAAIEILDENGTVVFRVPE
jgi:hypothetical protein